MKLPHRKDDHYAEMVAFADRAAAHGIALVYSDFQWDSQYEEWTLDGMPAGEWLDAMTMD